MSSLGWRHIAELMLQCSCGREAGRQLVCPSMSIFSVCSLSQLTMQQEIRADIVVCNVWVLKELWTPVCNVKAGQGDRSHLDKTILRTQCNDPPSASFVSKQRLVCLSWRGKESYWWRRIRVRHYQIFRAYCGKKKIGLFTDTTSKKKIFVSENYSLREKVIDCKDKQKHAHVLHTTHLNLW